MLLIQKNVVSEVIFARGHGNIRSTHTTTFEITMDSVLSKRGDCIIAVDATKGASTISSAFKSAVKREGVPITITIKCGGLEEVVRAEGSSRLFFSHTTDLVVRTSRFICGRTIAINANKAASNFSRSFVRRLVDPFQEIEVHLTVEI